MSAPDQLSMFEPEGYVLATLAKAHWDRSALHQRVAAAYAVQGFIATSKAHAEAAEREALEAFVCELALQFEQEAGL